MALTYKKLSELADMTSSTIDSTTRLAVTTGSTKVNNNLKVSDLVVNNLTTNNQYQALSPLKAKNFKTKRLRWPIQHSLGLQCLKISP